MRMSFGTSIVMGSAAKRMSLGETQISSLRREMLA